MAQSVPASKFVNIVPGVIGAGGNPLSLNGVMLTTDPSIPIGTVKTFSSAADVATWFGAVTDEYDLAAVYFAGYENSYTKPGALHVAQYNDEVVSAYLRGGSIADLSLDEIKALTGTVIVTVDGTVKTSSSIDLSGATSYSNAAALITAGWTDGPTCTYDSIRHAFVIISPTVGESSTIGFATGTLATILCLTEATGAVLSQGAAAASPVSFMTALAGKTQNWCSFFTVFEPSDNDKTLFADWVNGTNERYLYVAWDSSTVPANNADASSSFGALMKDAEYDGVYVVWPNATEAAFISGLIASIDYTRAEGRVDAFFKTQGGIAASVTDSITYDNLEANGYNFRAAVATANDRFVVHVSGQMPGKWLWLDPYVNQIYLNNQFQLALVELLCTAPSIPQNEYGRELLRGALQPAIKQALLNGTIRSGIELSDAQKVIVNQQAGQDIDRILYATGYYLQILAATAQQRALRQAGTMTFWYTDGGGVHSINMPSIDIQ